MDSSAEKNLWTAALGVAVCDALNAGCNLEEHLEASECFQDDNHWDDNGWLAGICDFVGIEPLYFRQVVCSAMGNPDKRARILRYFYPQEWGFNKAMSRITIYINIHLNKNETNIE